MVTEQFPWKFSSVKVKSSTQVGQGCSIPRFPCLHTGYFSFPFLLLKATFFQVGQGTGIASSKHRESPDAASSWRKLLWRDRAADGTTYRVTGHIAVHRQSLETGGNGNRSLPSSFLTRLKLCSLGPTVLYSCRSPHSCIFCFICQHVSHVYVVMWYYFEQQIRAATNAFNCYWLICQLFSQLIYHFVCWMTKKFFVQPTFEKPKHSSAHIIKLREKLLMS